MVQTDWVLTGQALRTMGSILSFNIYFFEAPIFCKYKQTNQIVDLNSRAKSQIAIGNRGLRQARALANCALSSLFECSFWVHFGCWSCTYFFGGANGGEYKLFWFKMLDIGRKSPRGGLHFSSTLWLYMPSLTTTILLTSLYLSTSKWKQ